MLRRRLALTLLVLAGSVTAGAAPASAVVPETAVAGSSSKWFSGSLIQQAGQNCSVLGSPYSEVMVSGIGSYGGTAGVVKIGDAFWTSVLVAIPGNPCGPGSSAVSTEVAMPPGTSFDPTRSIRCFYLDRNATNVDQFQEVTGQTWNAFGGSGQMCPSVPSAGTNPGTVGAGFRPLPNGSQFSVFVPVKATQQAAGGAGQVFDWVLDSTGVYANPALSRTNAFIFPAGGGSGAGPFVYFSRSPSALPFWKGSAPVGLRNRAEFFANLYSAGLGGAWTFQIHRTQGGALVGESPQAVGAPDTYGTGWNPAIAAGPELWQTTATGEALGPNGGYVPFAYDETSEAGVPMRITWRFTPSSGPPVTGTQDFTTLPGPDADGDGVADGADSCPAVAGTTTDGCLPAAPPDPDGDGVYGDEDACPTVAAPGQLNGCPGGAVPPATTPDPGTGPGAGGGTTPPPVGGPAPTPGTGLPTASARPVQLLATLTTRRNTRLRAAALRKGLKLKVRCSRDSTAKLVLRVGGAAVKRLGLKGRTATVAQATGRCTAARGATLTLRPAKRTQARVAKLRRPVSATLALTLTAAGATSGSSTVAVKVG